MLNCRVRCDINILVKVIKGGNIKLLDQMHRYCLKNEKKKYQNASETRENIQN